MSTNALDRLDSLDKEIQSMRATVTELQQSMRVLIDRFLSVEQTCTALGKTLNATVQELVEKHNLSGDNLLDRIRKHEDDVNKERVAAMVKHQIIQPSEFIDPSSLVIVSKMLQEDDKLQVIAEYYPVEVPSPHVDAATKQNLIGKKVGDSYAEQLSGNKSVITTVKEIYNIREGERSGEPPSAESPSDEQASEKPSS